MSSTAKLKRSILSALKAELPDWDRHKSSSLKRECEGFVQWIGLQGSMSGEKVRPSYSIQCLAERFSSPTLTLGEFIYYGPTRGATWINYDDWEQNQTMHIAQIIRQTKPSPKKEFSLQSVLDYLESSPMYHVSYFESFGIALILNGNSDKGIPLIREALNHYQKIEAPWGIDEVQRVEAWLNAGSEKIKTVLESDALIGRELLGLK